VGQNTSLAATIRLQRPDLLLDYSNTPFSPISIDPPPGFFKTPSIPDVGELMSACFMYDHCNIHNWWIGEKYDGIRACWNPNTAIMYSRQGFTLRFLWTFYPAMPMCFLDGEIFAGRNNYARVGILPRINDYNTHMVQWEFVRFIVFDNPRPLYRAECFEKRMHMVLKHICPCHPFITVAHRLICYNNEYMHEYSKDIVENGGEGVILRNWGSKYESGKSTNLMKYKTIIDAEALVVDIAGLNYTCTLFNGEKIIALKPTGIIVKRGDVVAIANTRSTKLKHNSVHKIWRVRYDLKWEDVIK